MKVAPNASKRAAAFGGHVQHQVSNTTPVPMTAYIRIRPGNEISGQIQTMGTASEGQKETQWPTTPCCPNRPTVAWHKRPRHRGQRQPS